MRWLNVAKVALFFSAVFLAFSAAGENATLKYPRYAFLLYPSDAAVYGVNSSTGTLSLSRIVAGAGGLRAVTHPNGRFIYCGGYGVLRGFSVQANGSLRSLPGSPYSVPGASNLTSISLSHSGKTLAVADYEFNYVWSYAVDTITGALTLAPGAPFTAGPGTDGLTIDHSSKFLYVSVGSNDVYAFSINPTNAVLTAVPGSPFSLSAGNTYPEGLIGDSFGKYLYVSGTKGVDGFSVNSQTGALQLIVGSPFAGPRGNAGAFAADPLGKFVYAGGGYGAYVYTLNGTTGALKVVAGSPFGIWAGSIAPDPTGNYLYTGTGVGGANVVRVNRSTGALTLLNGYSSLQQSTAIVVSTGAAPVKYTPKFAYVANQGDNTVTSYGINATSGALVKIGSSAVGTYPSFLTTDLTGRFLFVTNCQSNNLSVFKINASKGVIVEVPGSPYATGGCPLSAAMSPSANYVYVGSGDYTVSTFSIDPGTGQLTSVSSTSFQQNCGWPSAMVIDPTGTNLYAACGNLAGVATLTPTPVLVGNGSVYSTSLIEDPHGGWGWGVMTGKAVEQIGFNLYSVGFESYGPLGGSPTGGLAVEPFGRFLYAVEGNANDVQASSIALGGALTLIPGSPFAAGTSPVAGASDFSGRFLYIVNQGSNDLSGYAVEQLTGALTPLTPATVGTGKGPISIVTTGTTH
jgi:6-phosphogluconolactonase (cycloisomerase 2 family)